MTRELQIQEGRDPLVADIPVATEIRGGDQPKTVIRKQDEPVKQGFDPQTPKGPSLHSIDES